MKNKNFNVTSILATIPILLIGVLWLVEELCPTNGILSLTFFIGFMVSSFILLGIGWVKNFPKWTIHSIGISFIVSLYLMNVSSPILNRTDVWGVFALIPLILTLIISILIHPSFQPLKQLYNQIKEEKNVLIFLFYGILLFILMMGFDEMHRPFLFMYPAILTVLAVITTILYLENKSKTQRNLILIIGTIIPILIAIMGIMNLFGK
jgi:hypothetical protein